MSRSQPSDDSLIRIAFDLSPSGMLAVDEKGLLAMVNRETERLFGWSQSELIGRPLDLLVPARFRGAHEGHRARYLGEPSARPMGAGRELYGLRKDGTEFPVEIGLNPVTVDGRRFVLATVVDITARRQLEAGQRRSQKLEAIGTLAGGIAHDFNNILLSIVGHTELALRDPRLGAAGRGDLERVLRGAERGRELVKRILLFSRDAEITRARLCLDQTIGEALTLLRASLPNTIEVRAELDPATPAVIGDETQIHQMLMNLVTNSAHALPGGGTIRVEVAPFEASPGFAERHPGMSPGAHARVAVKDDGEGMSPETVERALEPFFTTRPPGQGTGLGLSIVHGIVRSVRGGMDIESAEGRGTAVILYLPAAGAPGEAPPAPTPEGARQIRARVLLVEDDAALSLMQRRQLEFLGYAVTAHTSSLAALEDFRSRPADFDLLITDDSMPHMTGTRLAGEILKLRPGLPVLMVSGGDRGEVRSGAGIGLILLKPHSAKQLDDAIREVMKTGPPQINAGS